MAKRRTIALQWRAASGSARRRHAAAVRELARRAARAPGTVIYLPTLHWGYLQQRPHQLLRELARRGFVSVFCTTRPAGDGVDGLRELEPNLFLCSDPRLVGELEAPVLWLNWTVNGAFLPFFKRPRVVYEYIDELEVFGFHCPRMEADHRDLVQRADVVVASADRLHAAIRGARPDAVLAPNGVAPEDFSATAGAPVPPSSPGSAARRGRWWATTARWRAGSTTTCSTASPRGRRSSRW